MKKYFGTFSIKIIASAVLSGLCFLSGCASVPPTHMARITVHVVDESGQPIANAPVRTGTVDGYRKGSEWWGYETTYREITVLTDKNGIAVMTASVEESRISYGVRDFPGYYRGGGWYEFKKSATGWRQPWNPKVELVLKKIGVQVPMYARAVGGPTGDEKIPATGKPIGFDLMIGDWLPPYGKGATPDFVFELDNKITGTEVYTHRYANGTSVMITNNLYDNKLTIRFSNEGDGIQFVAKMGGGLRLPKFAPPDGYQPVLNKRAWLEQATNQLDRQFVKIQSDYNKDADYFFRVRTKKDADGNIVSALYGKIYGDFSCDLGHGKIGFTYYLNPEPNSRNMEFNTQSNLFRNLSLTEKVYLP